MNFHQRLNPSGSMTTSSEIQPMDLAAHAASYTYDESKFKRLQNVIAEKIMAYDKRIDENGHDRGYGHFLWWHLVRTSSYLEKFMIYEGYDADITQKISKAFLLHDAGKILQDIWIWEKTKEKPTDEKKKIRAQHTELGKIVLLETAIEIDLQFSDDDFKHIETIIYMMETHHERINGHGPLKFKDDQLDKIIQIAGIIDEIDGKIKLDHENLESIFYDIRSPKHRDKFDLQIVNACYAFCQKTNAFTEQFARPSTHPHP